MQGINTHSKVIRKKANGDGYIEDEIANILRIIQDDIDMAVEGKRTKSITPIPTNFEIPTMEPERAQKHIYYFVLESLCKCDYTVKIEIEGRTLGEQRAWIHVEWLNDGDRKAEEYMDKFIQAHSYVSRYTPPNMGNGIGPSRRRRAKKTKTRTITKTGTTAQATTRTKPGRVKQIADDELILDY